MMVFHEGGHGVHVEYLSKAGRAFLWYPGNRRVVVGDWKIDGRLICFRYGPETYNLVTRRRGGSFSCSAIAAHRKIMQSQCAGDIFGLTSARIPCILSRHRSALVALQAKCGGKP